MGLENKYSQWGNDDKVAENMDTSETFAQLVIGNSCGTLLFLLLKANKTK